VKTHRYESSSQHHHKLGRRGGSVNTEQTAMIMTTETAQDAPENAKTNTHTHIYAS
jgi:hypothetical protein